ncbi:MAG TPA: lamin tail domain-containing protein, partial [Solirubrobacterales bacterium]|nr:lamin tail domain-containing protein [Solirubrobacterales bacterium]
DVCIPTWLGVLSAILVIVALVWLGRSWRRRRRERREGRAPRKRMPLSRGDWIGLAGLLLGIAGTVGGIVHCEDHPPAVAISLADSRLNPAEYDDPSDEYVCLVSDDEEPVSLAGWELHGAERRVNVLPRFTLEPGAAVRVHPGRGTDSARDLYGEEGSPEWRNEGGQITLLDGEGQEVDAVGYGERGQDDGSGECGAGAEAPVAP